MHDSVCTLVLPTHLMNTRTYTLACISLTCLTCQCNCKRT